MTGLLAAHCSACSAKFVGTLRELQQLFIAHKRYQSKHAEAWLRDIRALPEHPAVREDGEAA